MKLLHVYNTETKAFRLQCAKHTIPEPRGQLIVMEVEQQDVADTFNPNVCEICDTRKAYGAFR